MNHSIIPAPDARHIGGMRATLALGELVVIAPGVILAALIERDEEGTQMFRVMRTASGMAQISEPQAEGALFACGSRVISHMATHRDALGRPLAIVIEIL